MWMIEVCIRLMSSAVIDPKKVKRERRVIILNNMVDSPWAGEFGRSYVVRNSINAKELDSLYHKNFGISRSELNEEFLSGLDRSMSVLEVGCNIGLQLVLLKNAGYRYLYGFDISSFALNLSLARPHANLLRSSALYFPFTKDSFDMVFSSGVLIHISPKDLNRTLDEIYRCSRRYIWCYEYFAEKETEVEYRGKGGLLWKSNYIKLFTDRFSDLSIIRSKRLRYISHDNVDIMFMLEKRIPKD